MPATCEIKVIATAAFKAAYIELVPQFERASGHQVVTTWTNTTDIVTRVIAGEATDLAVMSATAIDELIAAGKFAPGGRANIASSWVAMAVQQGAAKPDIRSGEAFKRAMLDAKSIAYSTGPSGVYLTALFQRMGIADQLAGKVRQIKGEPVGACVARGEIEVGFQQMSELMPVLGIDIVGGLSKDIEEITFFATGRHADTKVADAANALTAFFKTPAAHDLIRTKGMHPA